ncbi:hypothetical protein QBC45DRAFT_488155 [Copromyces sp. CBS 386.78]|nr:hypothetical protein QBC45DRAFT_488155 [Copromyces sp. CBS 386.78]
MKPHIHHLLLLLTLHQALLGLSTASTCTSSEIQPGSTQSMSPTSDANYTATGSDGTSNLDGQGDVAQGGNKQQPSAEGIAVFVVIVSMVTWLCWVICEVVMCEIRRYRSMRERVEYEVQDEEPEEMEMTDMAHISGRT